MQAAPDTTVGMVVLLCETPLSVIVTSALVTPQSTPAFTEIGKVREAPPGRESGWVQVTGPVVSQVQVEPPAWTAEKLLGSATVTPMASATGASPMLLIFSV